MGDITSLPAFKVSLGGLVFRGLVTPVNNLIKFGQVQRVVKDHAGQFKTDFMFGVLVMFFLVAHSNYTIYCICNKVFCK